MAIRHDADPGPPAELVAGGAQWSPLATAALVGGAIAATGAWFGTRAIARRNARSDGRPLNSVMANAITACDVAHPDKALAAAKEPPVAAEPAVPAEPRV